MKLCYTCRTDKPEESFNRNRSRRDGLNSICKECSGERSRRYYKENRDKHKKVTARARDAVKEVNRVNILELLSHSECADCGETDVVVLEFDHVEGKKRENISRMVSNGTSWKAIQEEICKCEVVCANCHRRRTHKRARSYRVRLTGS